MNLGNLLSSMFSNVREGHGWNGVTFKQTDLEGNQVGELFTNEELKDRLDAVKASGGSAKFYTQCPHLNSDKPCSEEWHDFSLTFNGKEFLYHFLAYKMGTVGSVWIDPNDFSSTPDQGSGDDTSTEGVSSEGD